MPVNSERSDILRKVRGLIAKADGTNNPHEADAFRKKADAMMLQYRIAQHELKSDSEASREINPHDYDLSFYTTDPFGREKWSVMQYVARHCRAVLVGWEFTGLTIPVVASDEDFEYFDMLFTNIILEMSNGLEPKPRRDEREIDYLVRAKEAGMKWERIAELMIQHGINESFEVYARNVGVRFTKMYTDYCNEHARPRLRVMPKTYQNSFVRGFVAEINDRLFKMRREVQAEYDMTHEGQGTELVLADMKRLVDARTRQLFGSPPRSYYRGSSRDTRKVDSGAFAAGRQAAANMDLGARGMSDSRQQIER